MPHRVRQVEAIANGTVIDHLPSRVTLKAAGLLGMPDDQLFIGVNLGTNKDHPGKGVIKIANRELSDLFLSRLAMIAPGATINIIRDYNVVQKSPVRVPEAFTDIARCPNRNCVTNHEPCGTRFDVQSQDPLTVCCHYCEREFEAAGLPLL